MYTVYILRTSANTLYIGQTNDLDRRLKQHASKKSKAAKYLRAFPSFQLVHTEQYHTKSEALKREIQLKKLTKLQKEKLILNNNVS